MLIAPGVPVRSKYVSRTTVHFLALKLKYIRVPLSSSWNKKPLFQMAIRLCFLDRASKKICKDSICMKLFRERSNKNVPSIWKLISSGKNSAKFFLNMALA